MCLRQLNFGSVGDYKQADKFCVPSFYVSMQRSHKKQVEMTIMGAIENQVSHQAVLSYILVQSFVLLSCYNALCGLGSSVSIATDYGLDGPGIESRWV